MPTAASAQNALQAHFGFPDFRPFQRPVVESVMAGRHALAVLPTGAGKSVCFQVPAVALGGLTIVVSPLVSLMQDQVGAARSRGIAAEHLSGELPRGRVDEVLRDARVGQLSLLYVSPERLPMLACRAFSAGVAARRLAVDEAHCISEWGHDFRPAFRRIGNAAELLGRPPIVALTGSATPAVRGDIMEALIPRGEAFDVHLASFDRPNLWFGARRIAREPDRLAVLRTLLRRDETAIVYASTRRATEKIARALRYAGHVAEAYHAGLSRERRDSCLDRFLRDDVRVVVATSAFGMGIDKPGVRRVVHWSIPPTPESYYQEAGRAGRDGAPARCYVLFASGDAEIHERQLDVTFPPRRTLRALWSGKLAPERVTAGVRASAERLQKELGESQDSTGWRRIQRRRESALARLQAVVRYASGHHCRRRALVGYFGERLEGCSGCDVCEAPPGATLYELCRRIRRLAALPGSATSR
jgi:ATP-dependent DNA helicase RecQ